VGMSRAADLFFVVSTFLVSIPTGIKFFNWLATLYGGRISFASPMLFCLLLEGAGAEVFFFNDTATTEIYTYDINTNTNYNPAAEAEAGVFAMKQVAAYLGHELERLAHKAPRPALRSRGSGGREDLAA